VACAETSRVRRLSPFSGDQCGKSDLRQLSGRVITPSNSSDRFGYPQKALCAGSGVRSQFSPCSPGKTDPIQRHSSDSLRVSGNDADPYNLQRTMGDLAIFSSNETDEGLDPFTTLVPNTNSAARISRSLKHGLRSQISVC